MSNKIFYPLLLVASLICLLSCNASKQATKHFNKAVDKDKPTVAKLTRDLFPCIETAADTVSVTDTLFDLIEVECPPNSGSDYEPTVVYKDGKTVTKTNTVQVRVPKYIRTTKTITYKIEDSAKIYVLQADLDKQTARAEKKSNGLDWWRKWCLITWGLVLLAGAGWLLRKRIGL